MSDRKERYMASLKQEQKHVSTASAKCNAPAGNVVTISYRPIPSQTFEIPDSCVRCPARECVQDGNARHELIFAN